MIACESMRRSFKTMGVVVALLAGALALPACSDGQSQTGSVEILHWWKQGGEAEAIGKLLDLFKRENPTIKIVDSSVDGSKLARAAVRSRISLGVPPDTFQANGGWGLMAWVLYNNEDASQTLMQAIDDSSQDWIAKVPDPVLRSVSFDGHVYGVPLNIHRLNTLFYNKALFARFGIIPEQLDTLDKMFAAAEAIKKENERVPIPPSAPQPPITPISLGFRVTEGDMGTDDTWTLSLVFFENILVSRLTGSGYERFFLAPKGDDAFTPTMTDALADFRKLVSYSNLDAPALTWNEPLDMVLRGEAAMTIMGDWGKGYANAAGYDDQTFGVMPVPGTQGTFVFTTDTFGMPIGALNRENTIKLLQLFGSREGQDTFNPIKGSISPRRDAVIDDRYDAIAKKTFADFRDRNTVIVGATSILAPQVYVDAISAALAEFAKARENGNASTVQHTLDNYSDILGSYETSLVAP